jgi:hypothetical protein
MDECNIEAGIILRWFSGATGFTEPKNWTFCLLINNPSGTVLHQRGMWHSRHLYCSSVVLNTPLQELTIHCSIFQQWIQLGQWKLKYIKNKPQQTPLWCFQTQITQNEAIQAKTLINQNPSRIIVAMLETCCNKAGPHPHWPGQESKQFRTHTLSIISPPTSLPTGKQKTSFQPSIHRRPRPPGARRSIFFKQLEEGENHMLHGNDGIK